MAHKLIIQTTSGSLKHDIKIALALTPKESASQTYGKSVNLATAAPVAIAGMEFFSNSDQSRELEWDEGHVFATYETIERGGRKECVLKSDRSPFVPAGKMSYVSREGGDVHWKEISNHSASANLSIAHTNADDTHNISLVKQITCDGHLAPRPIAAWPAIQCWAGSSIGLLLQAYIVDGLDYDGTILEASDCLRPLFVEPLNCDELPKSSAWTLAEGGDGVVRLEKMALRDMAIPRQDSKTRSLEQAVEGLMKSFNDMKKQLDSVVKSLEDTQQRLSAVENSAITNQAELDQAKVSIMETRGEISRLGRKAPDVTKLAASLNRAEARLDIMESSVRTNQDKLGVLAETHSQVSKLEASVQRTQQQISAIDASVIDILGSRIGDVEAKANGMDESLGHVQDQLSAARTASGVTRDRVERLNRGVLAMQATADTLAASVEQGQERISAVEDNLDRAQQQLGAIEINAGSTTESAISARVVGIQRQSVGVRMPASPAQGNSTMGSESFTALQRQVNALDRRVPVMETKLDRLEKSHGIMERRTVPTVDEKAMRLERLLEKTQDELTSLEISFGTTRDELGGLGSRVADVEVKVDHFSETWVYNEPSSPGVFPSQAHSGPHPI